MEDIVLYGGDSGLGEAELRDALVRSLADCAGLRRVLLVPPDFTRLHSGAGRITNLYYHMLCQTCQVDVLPALGTHVAMPPEQCDAFFGDIPYERILCHDWRDGVETVGMVPAAFVRAVSGGLLDEDIPVELDRHLLDGYDLILSIGQVVPHEVVGMANYTKNILVGCGGSAMINASHIMGAFYGLEEMMGRDATPVRQIFDYAQRACLDRLLPLRYVLTVTTAPEGETLIHGLFIGEARRVFEQAVALAQEKNMFLLDEPLQKVVVRLDPDEFHSTWLGNKAIYRTRMAVADGGQLIILAEGVDKFGEDGAIDDLIRKYGYTGREHITALCKTQADLQQNRSAAAHLIHGSSDGRFSITYCTMRLTKEEVEGVGFCWMDYGEAAARYGPSALRPGWNELPGEGRVYYIPNPALGLWADRAKFESREAR